MMRFWLSVSLLILVPSVAMGVFATLAVGTM